MHQTFPFPSSLRSEAFYVHQNLVVDFETPPRCFFEGCGWVVSMMTLSRGTLPLFLLQRGDRCCASPSHPTSLVTSGLIHCRLRPQTLVVKGLSSLYTPHHQGLFVCHAIASPFSTFPPPSYHCSCYFMFYLVLEYFDTILNQIGICI